MSSAITTTPLIAFDHDPWLAGILDRAVYRIALDLAVSTRSHEALSEIDEAVRWHASAQSRAMYFARVPVMRTDLLRCLTATGLYVVDVAVTLVHNLHEIQPVADEPERNGVHVRQAAAGDLPAVLEIAGTCFRYSRFHLDDAIPAETAARVKQQWAGNCLAGLRGDTMLVATCDGRVAGFLAGLTASANGRTVRVIDLIGVGGDFQRRGIGRALVDRFVLESRGRCHVVKVGTQLANVPSLRLYPKCGFQVAESSYVLHRHVPREEDR